jgi:hypothetical protein
LDRRVPQGRAGGEDAVRSVDLRAEFFPQHVQRAPVLDPVGLQPHGQPFEHGVAAVPVKCWAKASTLPTKSSALNSTSLVFMSEFSFGGFDRGPQALFLIRGEVLRFGLGVDVEKDDRLMLGKIEVDDPCPAGPTPALQAHPPRFVASRQAAWV